MVMEEKTISPINLPTLPPIVEKDLKSDRHPTIAIASSHSKKTRSHKLRFDLFIEMSSISTTNSDITTTIVHDFIPNDTVPDQGGKTSPSTTTNYPNNRKDKETKTLKV